MKTCDRSYYNYTEKQAKFRKSIRSFLGFNLFIFILMLFGMGSVLLWKVSVIWGAILALKGYGFYGCDKKEDRTFADTETPTREQYGRPRRPEWKDNDLV